MTAIIGFQYREQPVLISDLLLTDISAPGDTAVRLPTIADVRRAFRKDGTPHSLSQKLVLISDQLAIAYSGTYSCAVDAITRLKTNFSQKNTSPESVKQLLDSFHSEYAGKLAIVGMLITGRSQIYQFGLNPIQFEDKRFGVVRAAGRGAKHLIAHLDRIEERGDSPGRTLNPLEGALCVSLSIIGHLQGREVVTGDNFNDFYGGGYELATIVGGRWRKVEDFMSVYWWAELRDNGEILVEPTPFRIIRTQYLDDILVIRAVALHDGRLDDETFTIKPDTRTVSSHELGSVRAPMFDARWICHQFVVKMPDGSLRAVNRVTYTMDANNLPLRVIVNSTQLDVRFRADYFSHLQDFVRANL